MVSPCEVLLIRLHLPSHLCFCILQLPPPGNSSHTLNCALRTYAYIFFADILKTQCRYHFWKPAASCGYPSLRPLRRPEATTARKSAHATLRYGRLDPSPDLTYPLRILLSCRTLLPVLPVAFKRITGNLFLTYETRF